MTLYLLAVALIVLAFLGLPLFAVIAAAAMLGFASLSIDLSVIGVEFYRLAETPILVALPLFTVAGYVLSESRTSERLVRLTQSFLGWLPSGLALVALVACALFTAFTGASGVTIVALGALLHPALIKDGYSENFSLGLVTTSGSLGLLFPPSIPLILYGIVAQQMNIGRQLVLTDLFLAGLLPGFLMILFLSLWSWWANRHNPRTLKRFSMREARAALRAAAWEIPLPFFLLGGIYSGLIAVSEAAAVTVLYVLFVEVVIYKEVKISRLPGLLRESMIMVGGVLIILGVCLAFTNYLIDVEAPMRLFQIMQARVSDRLIFLILLNVLLLILGCILDIFSSIIIMVPLILPVAVAYGLDPIHLGIIFLANMQIGYLTPPVGMNLFIASYRFNKPVTEIYRATMPFIIVLLATVLIITYWPELSMMFVK